ncbi:hypothetical protein BDR26DRAFT_865455, partial [Obelidium mucronatum]
MHNLRHDARRKHARNHLCCHCNREIRVTACTLDNPRVQLVFNPAWNIQYFDSIRRATDLRVLLRIHANVFWHCYFATFNAFLFQKTGIICAWNRWFSVLATVLLLHRVAWGVFDM